MTAVSRGVLSDLRIPEHKGEVVYNGVSLPDASTDDPLIVLPQGRLLAYTGSLYGLNRDPRVAMRAVALSSVKGFALVYAGKDAALWRETLLSSRRRASDTE